jgi:hypothetical protein
LDKTQTDHALWAHRDHTPRKLDPDSYPDSAPE